MEEDENLSGEQIRAFLEGRTRCTFQAQHKQELYGWRSRTSDQQDRQGLETARPKGCGWR